LVFHNIVLKLPRSFRNYIWKGKTQLLS
jgi:hypothetical protein